MKTVDNPLNGMANAKSSCKRRHGVANADKLYEEVVFSRQGGFVTDFGSLEFQLFHNP
jgi:hypothetical protein